MKIELLHSFVLWSESSSYANLCPTAIYIEKFRTDVGDGYKADAENNV